MKIRANRNGSTTGPWNRGRNRWLALGLVLGCAACAQGSTRLTTPVEVGFESPLNLIIVEARIAGQGPFRFLLDSGSTRTVVDSDLARRLGLDLASPRTRQGTVASSEVTSAPVRGGLGFELAPGFRVHVEKVLAAPFSQAARWMMGADYDGILGSEVFFQYVVEVDYVRRSVVFHDPSSYLYEGDGASLDLHFWPQVLDIPFLSATLVHGDVRLEDVSISIDSGGKTIGTASLGRRRDWDELVGPQDHVVELMGATGLSNEVEGSLHGTLTTRIDRFVMGPFEFSDPVVDYSATGPGFAAMGASLLHKFTAVFDYHRKRLILEPNARYGEALRSEMSGLLLATPDELEGAYRILAVSEDTPAREAGLRRNDVIEAVDGVPAREIGLNPARELFCRQGVYRLAVRRGEESFEVVLSTRSLYRERLTAPQARPE